MLIFMTFIPASAVQRPFLPLQAYDAALGPPSKKDGNASAPVASAPPPAQMQAPPPTLPDLPAPPRPGPAAPGGGVETEYDELTRRLEALKRS